MKTKEVLLIESLLPLAKHVRACWEDVRVVFPPLEIFNKRWLLASLFDAFEYFYQDKQYSMGISLDKSWILGAQLESPFAHRYPGDPLGEDSTVVSAAIGQFIKPEGRSSFLRLAPECRSFTVVEAYLHDLPSDGIPSFPWYNRAAQLAASMSETARASGIAPSSRMRCSLVSLVPRLGTTDAGIIAELTSSKLVKGLRPSTWSMKGSALGHGFS